MLPRLRKPEGVVEFSIARHLDFRLPQCNSGPSERPDGECPGSRPIGYASDAMHSTAPIPISRFNARRSLGASSAETGSIAEKFLISFLFGEAVFSTSTG